MRGNLTESIVEDAALAWLNPDSPIDAFDDPYQVTFATLHDTLLPKPISGELRLPAALRDLAAQLRVKDAERVVKEAV